MQAEPSIGAWAGSGIAFGVEMYGTVVRALDKRLGTKLGQGDAALLRLITGAGDGEITAALRACTKGTGDLSDSAARPSVLRPW